MLGSNARDRMFDAMFDRRLDTSLIIRQNCPPWLPQVCPCRERKSPLLTGLRHRHCFGLNLRQCFHVLTGVWITVVEGALEFEHGVRCETVRDSRLVVLPWSDLLCTYVRTWKRRYKDTKMQRCTDA